MLLLLHRARGNAGDYLIFERARSLVAWARPAEELIIAEAWRPLEDQLPSRLLATCSAIVIGGGPGYQNGMHRLYPLAETVRSGPPIVLLALGSQIVPGTPDQITSYRFDQPTRRFLEAIAVRSAHLGVRDEVSMEVLRGNGFGSALLTGDPAWYDLSRLDDPIRVPATIRSIAFSPPANAGYFAQGLSLLRALRLSWPEARLVVAFHRGEQAPFVRAARSAGASTVNLSGSAVGFDLYDQVDIHVGYRVHAHLYALSHARPSYLIAEDSRGVGVLRTLGQLGQPGFDGARVPLAIAKAAFSLLPRIGNPHRPISDRIGPALSARLGLPDVAGPMIESVRDDLAGHFWRHEIAREAIRKTLPAMRRQLDAIP